MLRIPQDASPILSMVGIDPGSRKLGLAVLEFDARTLEIVSTDSRTLFLEKMAKDSPLNESMGELYARLHVAKEYLRKFFLHRRPIRINSETPFFNKKFPGAYGPLVKTLTMIETAVVEYDSTMPLNYIPPSVVKMRVNANTKVSDKDNVRVCVQALPDLNYKGSIPFSKLDDNGVDGLAIVYGAFQQYLRELCLIQ